MAKRFHLMIFRSHVKIKADSKVVDTS